MPQTKVKGTGVSFDVPEGYEAQAGAKATPRDAARAARGEAPGPEVAAHFFPADSRVDLVARATIEPKAGAPRRGQRRSFGEAQFTADVEVSAGEKAVVLVEQEGVFRWVYAAPDDPGLPSRRRSSARTLHFEFDATPAAGTGAAPGRRSLASDVWDYLRTKLDVYVFRWVAGQFGGALAGYIDRNIATGLVPMGKTSPDKWRTDETFAFKAEEGKPFRILLFIHGTFSSTAGSFGGLRDPVLAPFGDKLFDAYDAVVGFEHKTLVETPEENVAQLVAALVKAKPPEGAQVDIVAFSRGGLLARVFVELQEEARRAALPGLRIGDVSFVGCTCSGTYLAEPENMRDLIDFYTTLFAWGARLVETAFPPSTATVEVTKTLLGGIGDFVKALAEAAITDNHVPGLAAMQPAGDLVNALNDADGEGGDQPRYRALAIDFEPPSLLQGGARMVAVDAVADRLFKNAANDLVVHTESMTSFGNRQRRLVDQVRTRSDKVFHTRYFDDALTALRLLAWHVPATSEAKSTPPAGALQVTPQVLVETLDLAPKRGTRSRRGAQLEAAFSSLDLPGQALAADRPAAGARGAARPKAEPVQAPVQAAPTAERVARTFDVEATMPAAPPVAAPFKIEVTLAREEIAPAAGEAAASASFTARDDDRLVVSVAGVKNAEVKGNGRLAGVTPPLEQERRVFTFTAECPQKGPAEFLVEVWRGSAQLCVAALAAEAGAVRSASKPELVRVQASDGYDGYLTLFVEDQRNGGDTALRLHLTGRGLNVEGTTTLDGRTYDDFIEEALSDLEGVFASASSTASVEEMVRAVGIQLADAIIPSPIRAALWETRDTIEGILLIADEHQLPWEVLFLDDPADPDKPGFFLAEKGLTRWFRNVGQPKRRHGRALTPAAYVKPDYLNEEMRLPGFEREIEQLDAVIGPLARWGASSRAMVAELRGKSEIGVLHLCGHGNTADGILREGLLVLQEIKDAANGRLVQDLLDSRLVAANVRFRADAAPVVFLNVCRAGRAARGLVGASGYARAFVAPRSRAGAGVFVAAQWEVNDTSAAAFSEAFYRALAAGLSLAVATSRAKQTARAKSDDLTWLAYCVYGDPATTFTA
ncbi:CHAT domain-containing protein [Xanthobacter wiegelii]|uniref:CHAT domain-containing protein n=1 Tax=Xanthobacter wiegelii TaxID=3119913 RepID=UPI003729C513